jgi:excisionase family DNA binding protein
MQGITAKSPRQKEIPLEQREFLSVKQAATLLGVSDWTVKAWVRKGHIPSRVIGGTRRIRRSDIDAIFD